MSEISNGLIDNCYALFILCICFIIELIRFFLCGVYSCVWLQWYQSPVKKSRPWERVVINSTFFSPSNKSAHISPCEGVSSLREGNSNLQCAWRHFHFFCSVVFQRGGIVVVVWHSTFSCTTIICLCMFFKLKTYITEI